MSLEAIIFDVDGTLAETEEVHRAAFNEAFRQAGLAWHWDQTLYARLLLVTGGKERIRFFIESNDRTELGPELDDAIARLHAAKTALYGALVADGALQLRPGFRELLEQAHEAGIRLAIATTTSLPNITALLQSALGPRAERYFEVIAAGDSVPRKKPAPDVYLSALERLRVPAGRCVAIEDSELGLQAARAAGIATLVVRSAYTRSQNFQGAALVLDSLEQAPARLQRPGLLEAVSALLPAA